MSKLITLQTSGSSSYSLQFKPPAYGYSTVLNLALNIKQAADGSIIVWDNGIANDTRICKIPTWHLNKAKQNELNSIIKDSRGKSLFIDLGNQKSGFFPFGADLGDCTNNFGTSAFECYLLEQKRSGVLRSPWLHFNSELSFVMKSDIDYMQLNNPSEGNFLIGTIGIKQPQDEVTVTYNQGLISNTSNNGTAYYVDNGTKADYFTSEVKLSANSKNMAAIIRYFQQTIRGNEFTITCPMNVFLFGRENVKENGQNNVYTCKLLSNEIEMVHDRFNKFTFTLKLIMVSRT